ncbi:MAG: NusG domain II-containing protein [Proteobacteria bacterium]|nr:NusG domain II-containing protein [Pseudomonadota bacterium]
MLSRRSFLKLSGLTLTAMGTGYAAGKLTANWGPEKNFAIHGFLPEHPDSLKRAVSVFAESIPGKINLLPPLIYAPDKLARIVNESFGYAKTSLFSSISGGQATFRIGKLKEPVDSDILITDNLHSIYSLEKDFSPLLTAFRKQIQNKKAGYFFSAEYVERKLFDAFFDTGKKFAVIKNENRLVDKVSLNRKPTDINLNGSRGNTIITVGDGSAFVKSSSCRHKLCEHAGQAFSPGDVIACAPNKVLIKIEVG